MEDGSQLVVTNPSEYPEGKIAEVREPSSRATLRIASHGTLLKSVTLSTGDMAEDILIERNYVRNTGLWSADQAASPSAPARGRPPRSRWRGRMVSPATPCSRSAWAA